MAPASESIRHRVCPADPGLIPAHNEAATLPGVIAEVRESHPDLDLLVIDDGSTDGTVEVIETLGVRWMRPRTDGHRQRDARRPSLHRAARI